MIRFDSLKWGQVSVGGKKYRRDLVVQPDGTVRPRKNFLLSLFAHTFEKAEIERLRDAGAEVVVVGLGVRSAARLSEEAKRYAEETNLELHPLPSPEAIERFNHLVDEGRRAAAIIHITC